MNNASSFPLSGGNTLTSDDRPVRLFLVLLAVYFLLQIVVRVSLSEALDLDEAEQVFFFQTPGLGYGAQPPLYTWLQWASFSLFGVNLFALSVVKNVLLYATYLCFFLTARPLIGAMGAMAASASLIMMPAIGWESQRDLTHSVMLVSMASLTLWSYFLLLRKPDVWRYTLFGLMLGLGFQSKYNFAIFASGLVFASLLINEHRRMVWNRKVVIAIVVCTLCVLPHGWWVLHHFHEATSGTINKMAEGRGTAYFSNVVSGLWDLLEAIVLFVTPLWLVYLLICRSVLKQSDGSRDWANIRFMIGLLAFFVIVLLTLIFAGKVTSVKGRWLMPLMFFTPLVFFLIWPRFNRPEICRRIAYAAGGFALLVLLMLPGRVLFGAYVGKHVRAHFPFPELSRLLEQRYPSVDQIVSDAKLTAGNLHFQRPHVDVVLLQDVLEKSDSLNDDLLLVVRGGTMNDQLAQFRQVFPQYSVGRIEHADLQMNYTSNATMSFDFVHLVSRKP